MSENDPPLTPAEAQRFILRAGVILARLEDAERPPSYAVPKSVMNCGEATVLLGALCRLILRHHPYVSPEPEVCADLAAENFRENNH